MRAARVLEMLFVLQQRRQSTARELAERLEVSERTVLRDVEALSEAGVPIFAVPGAGGGIRLMDGFDMSAAALTDEEAECVLLAGQPRLARHLGLGPQTRTARHKLLAALTDHQRRSAEGLDQWLLHDPEPWNPAPIPYGELRRLARCVRECREIEVRLGPDPAIRVRPLGLVTKSGRWYLVHQVVDSAIGPDADPRVVSLDGLVSTRITKVRFDRPVGFELGPFWDDHVAAH